MTIRIREVRDVAVILAVTIIGGSWLPFAIIGQERDQSPAEKLAGSWRAEMSETQALVLHVRGDELEMQVEVSGAITPIWKAKLLFPKVGPDRHMDWVEVASGKRTLPDNKVLYQLTGNTLIVMGGGPKDRPARFYSGPGAEPKALIFTRVTP